MADRRVPLPLASIPRAVRQRYEQRSDRLTTNRAVREALISLAGLLGRPVLNQAGEQIGRLTDLVARWDGQETYPPVTGLVVQVGRRRAWVPAEVAQEARPDSVRLRDARLDLREFAERPGEVRLAADVLDHQLVDIEGVRVVRPSDLYLTQADGQLLLVGLDTGFGALARRLGPARWRTRPSAEQVIDWADVQAFGTGADRTGEADGGTGRAGAVRLAGPREELRRLHPAELADLLEDLGRAERQELLGLVSPESAADALEEMQPDQLAELLSESDPAEAAELLARMESDEAADALRDLAAEQREGLLARLPKPVRAAVERLLAKDEHTAGGLMTTMIVCVTGEQTVAQVKERLAADVEHISDIDSVVVVSDDGRLLDDVTLGELLLARPDATVDSLVGPPWPVTVLPDAGVAEIAARFVESRRLSLVVTDEDERPVGRILADDVVDMLLPERGRFRFPRVLS